MKLEIPYFRLGNPFTIHTHDRYHEHQTKETQLFKLFEWVLELCEPRDLGKQRNLMEKLLVLCILSLGPKPKT